MNRIRQTGFGKAIMRTNWLFLACTASLLIVQGIGLPAATSAPQDSIKLTAGGAGTVRSIGPGASLQTGYAAVTVSSGSAPYATAIFSYAPNGIVASEVGVPVSPPTKSARLFIEYRKGVASGSGTIDVNTGIAAVNMGTATANIGLVLRDLAGSNPPIASGTLQLAAKAHIARFINEFGTGLELPSGFASSAGFATLEVTSDQPLSIMALRMTLNQRNEALFTSTPVADLSESLSTASLDFPQIADGGGYQTTLVLMNTSDSVEAGLISLRDNNGAPMKVRLTGDPTSTSQPSYRIPAKGAVRLETDGSPADVSAGWAQLVPTEGSAPAGAGLFGFTINGILASESGISSSLPTKHARIYVDQSSGHDTGLALVAVDGTAVEVNLKAYQPDGVAPAGSGAGSIQLTGYGHRAAFVTELITDLPHDFTGVLDIQASTPFAALTLRALVNERKDVLMATFPTADVGRSAPVPIIFPHIAAGGGYQTEFVFLDTGVGGSLTVDYLDAAGTSLEGFTAQGTSSTIALNASSPTAAFGTTVTFTAAVTPTAATGLVTFTDSTTGTLLGSVALNSGSASLATSALAVGSHVIVARYQGSDTHAGSTSSAVTVTVGTTTTESGFVAAFSHDNVVQVTVYTTQAYTDGVIATSAPARDADTGLVLTTGDGQVNFMITVATGYQVTSVAVTPSGNYKNLKTPEELGRPNTYRITRITGNVTVTITTQATPDNTDTYNPGLPTTIVFSDAQTTVANNNGGVVVSGGTVTVSLPGIYDISGAISEGSLIVDTDDGSNVTLLLGNLTIASASSAPLAILAANNAVITIAEGATVTLTDRRPTSAVEDDDTPNAALYAACDLLIKGGGTLNVTANCNNGIGSKDDLDIRDATITVTAANHGIKGSDSLTITSGTIGVTAKGGDGLKTSNSDISSSRNQRGTLTISGGNITINAAADGIDAAYNVSIANDPTISIYTTRTYATGVDTAITTSANILYLRVTSTTYSASYRYAVYFTASSSGNGTWVDGVYADTQMITGRSYYYYRFEKPQGYAYYALYRFPATAANSLSTYNAKSATATLNTAYDMLVVSSNGIAGTTISVSWLSYATQTVDPQTGGPSDPGYSAKGISADNSLTISGGKLTIFSYDDGIHANSDALLDNGSYGEGNVTITGGTITITTKDDGVHADTYLTISGGTINVLTSYEGLEAPSITIDGGNTTLFSTDDGMNAPTGSVPARIVVSGGTVDVTVGAGDTDAIDSNGSYSQTGGLVVARSALSGGMGGALDTQSAVSITGGAFIGIGISERVAVSAGSNRSTGAFNVSITTGNYTVRDSSGTVVLTFTTPSGYTYSSLWISSDQLQSGRSYTLYRGSTALRTWTQS
jgi:hypothetical protein